MYLENVTERIGVGGVGWTRQVPKGPRGVLGWETTVVQLLVSHGRGVCSGWTLYTVWGRRQWRLEPDQAGREDSPTGPPHLLWIGVALGPLDGQAQRQCWMLGLGVF